MEVIIQDDWHSLRRSLDGQLALIKYADGPKPDVLRFYTSYTHQEIIDILAGEDWSQSI